MQWSRKAISKNRTTGAAELGSCLTDATREGHSRCTVRVLAAYVSTRTHVETIIAANLTRWRHIRLRVNYKLYYLAIENFYRFDLGQERPAHPTRWPLPLVSQSSLPKSFKEPRTICRVHEDGVIFYMRAGEIGL